MENRIRPYVETHESKSAPVAADQYSNSKLVSCVQWASFVVLCALWTLIGTPLWVWVLVRTTTAGFLGIMLRQLANKNIGDHVHAMRQAQRFWLDGFHNARQISFGEAYEETVAQEMPMGRLIVDSLFALTFWALTILGGQLFSKVLARW